MTTPKASDPIYFPGDTERERRRLQEQANLINPFMRDLMLRAGIRSGMRVLDVGSGAGDVALIAAELVGEEGAVLGVDLNSSVLETARARVEAAGHRNITLIPGDIRTIELDGMFDAVVGRAVLMYLANPAEALRKLRSLLPSGGPAAFLEVDLTTAMVCKPHSPLGEEIKYWITETIHRSGADIKLGYNLRNIFLEAGWQEPQLQSSGMMGGGAEWSGYDYAANTLRSILPYTIKFGVATAEEIDIDTLADRFRHEIVSQNGTVMISTWVSAWSKL